MARELLEHGHRGETRNVRDRPGPETDQFAADFRDGEAMAREWIAGKGDLPDLLHIVRDMLKGGLNGLEAGFLATVDASARGAQEGAGGAEPQRKQSYCWSRRRRRSASKRCTPAARAGASGGWERLGRYNQEAFADQQRAFGVTMAERYGLARA